MPEKRKIITQDGTTLTIPDNRPLIERLPSPHEAAKEIMNNGPSDAAVNAMWLAGKAPRN